MKRTTTPRTPRRDPLPVKPPIQEPSASAIIDLADLVVAGRLVEAAMTDGTFTLLMAELKRRGYAMVTRSEREKQAAPFVFRVGNGGACHDHSL